MPPRGASGFKVTKLGPSLLIWGKAQLPGGASTGVGKGVRFSEIRLAEGNPRALSWSREERGGSWCVLPHGDG